MGEEMEQPLGGEESPTIPTSKTFRGEAGVASISGRGLRNPFMRMPVFIGGFATFFAGGSATETLLTAKSATIFEAFRESDISTSLWVFLGFFCGLTGLILCIFYVYLGAPYTFF
jgi:hypothetical protein